MQSKKRKSLKINSPPMSLIFREVAGLFVCTYRTLLKSVQGIKSLFSTTTNTTRTRGDYLLISIPQRRNADVTDNQRFSQTVQSIEGKHNELCETEKITRRIPHWQKSQMDALRDWSMGEWAHSLWKCEGSWIAQHFRMFLRRSLTARSS